MGPAVSAPRVAARPPGVAHQAIREIEGTRLEDLTRADCRPAHDHLERPGVVRGGTQRLERRIQLRSGHVHGGHRYPAFRFPLRASGLSAGTAMRNVAPPAPVSSSVRRPPFASIAPLAIDSPRPVPPTSVPSAR